MSPDTIVSESFNLLDPKELCYSGISLCERRIAGLLTQLPELIVPQDTIIYNNIKSFILSFESDDIFVLDLSDSLSSWEQTSFAINSRMNGLVSPDFIFDSSFLVPGFKTCIGSYILRALPGGGYRPIIYIESNTYYESELLKGSLALFLLNNHPLLYHFDYHTLECIYKDCFGNLKFLYIDVRSQISRVSIIFNSILDIKNKIGIKPFLSNLSNISKFSISPSEMCRPKCSLFSFCFSSKEKNIDFYSNSISSLFFGFNSFDQAYRAISSYISDSDPEYLLILKNALLEYNNLISSDIDNVNNV